MQYQLASAQPTSQQLQQLQQQPKVKLEKTMNMMYDTERNRVYYTNMPNKRGGTQFLTKLPQVVNIMPIQHKNNVTGTVQGIVTSSGMLNKSLQRVITAPTNQTAQNQQQQLAAALRPGTTAILNAAGNVISTGNSTQNLASTATTASINDVNTVSSNNTSTINTVLGNSGCLIATAATNDNNLTATKLHNSDGTTAVSGININTTNR